MHRSKLAGSRLIESHTVAGTQRFPTVCRTLAALLPKLAEATGVGPVRPLRTITGFKPDKHANARLQIGGKLWTRATYHCWYHLFSRQRPHLDGLAFHEWRRVVSPSHMPHNGTICLANSPGPRPVNSPNWWVAKDMHLARRIKSPVRRYLRVRPEIGARRRNRTYFSPVRTACIATYACPANWCQPSESN
jgi:hypothetical protein